MIVFYTDLQARVYDISYWQEVFNVLMHIERRQ